MGKLIITDSVILKLEYEISQFQPDDPASDIAYVIVKDEVFDDYTRGYLTREMEELGNSLDGKEYLEEFLYFLKRVK
jgi:hypothetical protein